ncbi:MAG: hypothetical protein KJO90_07385 [Eudoraea sp.]|nr:hypothetical protein [Eudoraea sp.]
MRRILVDYKKLDQKAAALLIETYPYGYGDEDIIAYKNGQGELIQAVELRTEDILYLVKISKCLSNFIASFDDAIENELDSSSVTDELELELDMEDELDVE